MTDVVRCPSCGQANRMPELGSGKAAVCGRCKAPLAAHDGHPVTLTDASFKEQIARGNSVVDFWAAWCGPCRAIAPIVDEVADDYAGRLKVVKINVDDNPMTPARFGVRGIPNLIILKNGQVAEQIVGAVPKQNLVRAVDTAIA